MKAYIKAIEYHLPERVEQNDPTLRLTKKTGIYERHIAQEDECASDLAVQAAEKLFASGAVKRTMIDYLLFCTQAADYFLPTTACLIQERLNLRQSCGALDFNLGCSGYVYGLSLAKGLIESGQANNILLLTAETYSKYIDPEDYTVRPLFGDGAAATLVTAEDVQAEGLFGFEFGTDGSGSRHLIVPAGGMRNRDGRKFDSLQSEAAGQRPPHALYMNGSEISNFALRVVPETVQAVLNKTALKRSDIDYYVFHQANKFMLEFLQEKCELPADRFWNDVKYCGNTVSCSLPIALHDLLKLRSASSLRKIMITGFGVGFSWGGCIIDLGRMLRA